jgi:hypothetical protein
LNKNRHTYETQASCPEYSGVDLNSNFGYGFNKTEPCQEFYGGPEPFSEPETQAILNLTNTFKNIRIAANLHAFGNFLVIPFGSGVRPLTESEMSFYSKFHSQATFPQHNRMGTTQ